MITKIFLTLFYVFSGLPFDVSTKHPEPKGLNRNVAWHGQRFIPPQGYICFRAKTPITFDGKLNERSWKSAPWTSDFVDIEGARKPKPRFRTRVKMLWDDDYFYVAAEMDEPHVWATLTKHDSVIFRDNDFEVFLDPDGDNHRYMEYEINAFGTDWDLYLPKPYKDGGQADNSWEIPGLKKAVHIKGTINDPQDEDTGWTLELAFPWKVLGKRGGVSVPPKEGEQWRVNFSRVEWEHKIVDGKYQKIQGKREDNWVWSPQYVINMHRPETWGYVQFTNKSPGQAKFQRDRTGYAKFLLHRVYYAQRSYRHQHNKWAKRLDLLKLGLKRPKSISPLTMQVEGTRFVVSTNVRVVNGTTQTLRIKQDGKLEVVN